MTGIGCIDFRELTGKLKLLAWERGDWPNWMQPMGLGCCLGWSGIVSKSSSHALVLKYGSNSLSFGELFLWYIAGTFIEKPLVTQ